MAQLAWEDAAAFYARALGPRPRTSADPATARRVTAQPMTRRPPRGGESRCRLLRGLGLAQLRGFDLTAGSSTLRRRPAPRARRATPA